MSAHVSISMGFGFFFLLFSLSLSQIQAEECGKRFHHQDLDGSRHWVAGGVQGVRGAYPWLVSFQWKRRFENQHDCGATIISRDWVVTAAHCIVWQDGPNPAKFRIVAGEFNLKTEEGSEEARDVERIVVHPDYDEDSSRNDIALLRLSSPLEFGDLVQPACLPAPGAKQLYQTGKKGLISGWGFMTPKAGILDHRPQRKPDIFRVAQIPIIDTKICDSAGKYRNMIFPGMFCAGYLEGGVDSCRGDSGGPFVSDVEGRMTLLGVTSWGVGCAQKNKPGVYTLVADYIPWITRVSGVH